MDAVDEYVSPEETAELLGVPPDRIDTMIEQALLQPVEVEGRQLFYRAEVEALRVSTD